MGRGGRIGGERKEEKFLLFFLRNLQFGSFQIQCRKYRILHLPPGLPKGSL